MNLARPSRMRSLDVEIESDGGSGGGVANIVNAGRMKEVEEAEVFAFVGEAEFAAEALVLDIADDQVGLGGDAISNDGAFDVGDDGLDVGLVDAQDGGAVERYAIDELREGVLDVFEGVILIEMLAVDGGDDGDDRGQQQESAVAFVRFDDEIFAFAEAGSGAGLIDFAADDESGVEMGCAQD